MSFFAVSTVIESLVILIALLISYRKLNGSKPKINLQDVKLLLKEGSQFLLSSLCMLFSTISCDTQSSEEIKMEYKIEGETLNNTNQVKFEVFHENNQKNKNELRIIKRSTYELK